MLKLQKYGINGKVLNIIEDFLSERAFKVKVGNTFSDNFCVRSGVPQGSVLGPLLFLIYINDLPDGIDSYISLFADDVKLIVSSKNIAKTQEDLKKLEEWQKKWLLRFNMADNKCKVLHLGKNNPRSIYSLNSTNLPVVNVEKDLGVYVDNTLKWEENIEKAISKAKKTIGWVTRNVISRDKSVMLNIYKSLIRPHLEYCVQIWSPVAKHGRWSTILRIEGVQRQFSRLIEGVGILPYRERLEKLGLTTLLERRMRGDIIETFKILSGLANYGSQLFSISRSGYKLKYVSQKGKINEDFLPNRVVNYWNKIPDYVKNAQSIESCKNRLENFKIRNFGVPGNYWELSENIFQKINDEHRDEYIDFLIRNPSVARRRQININS